MLSPNRSSFRLLIPELNLRVKAISDFKKSYDNAVRGKALIGYFWLSMFHRECYRAVFLESINFLVLISKVCILK